MFGGKYLPHFKSLENVHRANLKKISRIEESFCFFDAEAEFETQEEIFNFDILNNLKVPKTSGSRVLCNITKVKIVKLHYYNI